jgi:hypothetical protein
LLCQHRGLGALAGRSGTTLFVFIFLFIELKVNIYAPPGAGLKLTLGSGAQFSLVPGVHMFTFSSINQVKTNHSAWEVAWGVGNGDESFVAERV